jgi:hypothetical protein
VIAVRFYQNKPIDAIEVLPLDASHNKPLFAKIGNASVVELRYNDALDARLYDFHTISNVVTSTNFPWRQPPLTGYL